MLSGMCPSSGVRSVTSALVSGSGCADAAFARPGRQGPHWPGDPVDWFPPPWHAVRAPRGPAPVCTRPGGESARPLARGP
eukprot:7029063-Lingulodinium_polyedra.AAC.1